MRASAYVCVSAGRSLTVQSVIPEDHGHDEKGSVRFLSGCPWLHVAEHGLEALHAGGLSVAQLVGQTTVQTEGLELQPNEAKAVVIEQHEQTRRALWTREAVASDQACSIKTETQQIRIRIKQMVFFHLLHIHIYTHIYIHCVPNYYANDIFLLFS